MPQPAFSRTLLLTAAPAEARAIAGAFNVAAPETDWILCRLDERFDLVRSGVGKVNAALAVARCVDPSVHDRIVNLGICGALPAQEDSATRFAAEINDIIIAAESVYADEGVEAEGGWKDIAAMGFPPSPTTPGVRFAAAPELMRWAAERLPGARQGAIATVSTCSGTDALARAVAKRTEGIAEAMEGAAAAHAAARCFSSRVRFLELRVVSNTTGDREKQVWNIPGALATLSRVVSDLRVR